MKVSPLTSARSTTRIRPGGDRRGSLLDRQGNSEILGEMIERAERQHAERHSRAGEHAGHGANAAVASADHDGIDLAALGLLDRPLGVARRLFAFHEFDGRRHAAMRQTLRRAGSRSSPASLWLKAPAPAFIRATTRHHGDGRPGAYGQVSARQPCDVLSLPCRLSYLAKISERALAGCAVLHIRSSMPASGSRCSAVTDPKGCRRTSRLDANLFSALHPALDRQVEHFGLEPAEVEMVDGPIEHRGHGPDNERHRQRLHDVSGKFLGESCRKPGRGARQVLLHFIDIERTEGAGDPTGTPIADLDAVDLHHRQHEGRRRRS